MRRLLSVVSVLMLLSLTGCDGSNGGGGNGGIVADSEALMFNQPFFPIYSLDARTDNRTARGSFAATTGIYAHGDVNNDGLDDLFALAIDGIFGGTTLQLRLGEEGSIYGPAIRIAPDISIARPALADFDRDGNLDVVYMEYGSSAVLRFGAGDGSFGPRVFLANPTSGLSPAFLNAADLDRDGDQDLTISTKFVLLNNGNGTFTSVMSPVSDEGSPVAPPTDFNGDHLPDLLGVFNISGNIKFGLAINLGAGIFASPSFGFKPAQSVIFIAAGLADIADLNHDGDADIVVLSPDNHYSYLGNGDGTFTEQPSGVPNVSGDLEGLMRVLDVYGDSNPDLITGVAPGLSQVTIHVGLGDGTFDADPVVPSRSSRGRAAFDCFAHDFNNDGTSDLFIGAIFVRLPNGQYGSDPISIVTGHVSSGIAALDVNDDAILDIVAVGDGVASTSLGDGHGAFQLFAESSIGVSGTREWPMSRSQHADFNADGRDDLLFTHYASYTYPTVVALNRGDGTLDLHAITNPFVLDAGKPADLDDDGFPDVVAISPFAQSGSVSTFAYFGRGNGDFDHVNVYDQPVGNAQPLTADIDGDGYLSVVVPTPAGNTATFETQPDRTFIPGPVLSMAAALATYDLDSDGFDDVLARDNTNGDLAIFYGRANGSLDTGPTFALTLNDHVTDVAVARLDDTEALYILVSTASSSLDYEFNPWQFTVLRPTDSRSYETAFSIVHPGRVLRDWQIADFTNDGAPDVLFSCEDDALLGLFEMFPGNGDGTFQGPLNFIRSQPTEGSTAVGDWDGDGDVDIATLVSANEIEVKLNNLAP